MHIQTKVHLTLTTDQKRTLFFSLLSPKLSTQPTKIGHFFRKQIIAVQNSYDFLSNYQNNSSYTKLLFFKKDQYVLKNDFVNQNFAIFGGTLLINLIRN